MDIPQLVKYLDQPADARGWLRGLGFGDAHAAHHNLVDMAEAGVTLDLLAAMISQLEQCLPRLADPDMVLTSLARFVRAARSPLSLGALFERDPEALPTLLQVFSTSQYLSDLLIRDPETFDLVRMTDGQPVSRETLVEEICAEVAALADEAAVMTALRRYKQRETLRIAYGDIIRRHNIDTVTRQISFLADALCEAAVQAAWRKLSEQRGKPLRPDGKPARFVMIALGKLGGCELNYSSDIDVIFLSDGPGETSGPRRTTNDEFFQRLARQVIRLLSEPTDLGVCYRVDLRLRPDGKQGATVIGVESALRYYDISGRTWERQAFVKARAAAGDLELGREFLEQLTPWIYRNYLNRADITGIQALKRRIEQRAIREGGETRNVKTGRGGLRDVEYVIQFLQLLHGGETRNVRTGNTIEAIARLEGAGCLTHQESMLLAENYELLRRIEHRLQIMFDLQTHTLPDSPEELRKVAIRVGYSDAPERSALEAFKQDYQEKTAVNRRILNFLLNNAFPDSESCAPEIDLVLDPDPSEATIRDVLSKYAFRDVPAAYQHLMALSAEKIPFLSTRRCRHFLASIAPSLLRAIASTPNPDATLLELSRVSDSIGGKGILWELFSFNAPSLKLYVHLCATSPYLSNILTSHPGMIDELMDSLVLDKLPSLESLQKSLDELCGGAEDLDPILHSFKNSNHLRVGVRDILGKEDIRRTHRALADIAESCLQQIAVREYYRMVERFGEPTLLGGALDGKPCEFLMLAMGKLGGREPNYHSDLDVVFLYEGDGSTVSRIRGRRDASTTNQHFFSQLCQRIIKTVTQLGPYGRLYELDPRLRPTGKNGALAVSLDEFTRYFATGRGQLWERQALCKARPMYGSEAARKLLIERVRDAQFVRPWEPACAAEIQHMRRRIEIDASPRNLKRAPGGTVDVEFVVQMLQLQYGQEKPGVLAPNTLDALEKLREQGVLSADDALAWSESYRFLRNIEARLRLMNTTARHDFPSDPSELRKLAFLLNYPSPEQLEEDVRSTLADNRTRFEAAFRQYALRS
ncbi:MAG: bifunctional [glutamate--ammonia ligase]-adenylyl-L-tyrosine phosphorylase/[glutamate--ammonia-ligase] adenylyltransferase [Pirellulales bacterium]